MRAAARAEKKAGAEANYNVLVILELHFTEQAAGLVMTVSLEIQINTPDTLRKARKRLQEGEAGRTTPPPHTKT